MHRQRIVQALKTLEEERRFDPKDLPRLKALINRLP